MKLKIKLAEQAIMGEEPQFNGPVTRSELAAALNWYNYFFSIRDSKEWISDYMRDKGFSHGDINKISSSSKPTQTDASLCRLAHRGAILIGNLNPINRINAMLAEIVPPVAESPLVVVPATIRENSLIIILDGHLDSLFDSGYVDTGVTLENLISYKQYEITQALNYLNSILGELELIGKDDQITEGYLHLSKKQVKNYKGVLTNLIGQLSDTKEEKVITRKPRRKKIKSPELQAKAVKYCQQYEQYKSIEPKKIVNAKEVWFYNIKYKKLTRLVSLAGGFTIKGTTVLNIDESNSYTKIIRKPNITLKSVLEDSKIKINKTVEALSTKKIIAKGRINSDTLLLRVF